MLGTGDELSIQLALLAASLAFGGVAVTQAGWTHRLLIRSCFVLAALLLALGCFWTQVAARFTSLSQVKVGPLFWFTLVTGLVLYLCFHASQKRLHAEREGVVACIDTVKGPSSKKQSSAIVAEDFVYGAVHRTFPPRYVARFAKNGSYASFYIDYSYLPLNVMGSVDWSQRRKVKIDSKDRFVVGESVSVPIAYRTEVSGRVIWRIGTEAGHNEPLLDVAFYRGRITVVDDEGNEQHTYFFMKHEHTKNEDPDFIGSHIFDAASIWT